jgi:tetratricopeptide (TPR) repeat protein
MNAAEARTQHNLGLQLHRHHLVAEAEPYYRRAVELDPEFQEAWTNLGLAVLAQKRPEEALAYEREALRLDPEYPDAHNTLGMAHYAQGNIAEAENCFRAALRLNPDHAIATLNLGCIRQVLNRVEQAEVLFRRALTLGVDPCLGKSNLSLALIEQARPEEAELCLREVLAERPDYAEARSNFAMALLSLGRLEEGWQAYESRWEFDSMATPGLAFSQPRWTGQALQGETVLLCAEQGFGDALQFCRYAPMVAAAGGRVVLAVPKALGRLMSTLDGIADVLVEENEALPPFDYYCPLLSLPLVFTTTMQTIPAATPYLRGDTAPWSDFLAGLSGLKVGLVWAGKSRTAQPHAVAIDKRRSMHLTAIASLLKVPGCSFVSLQCGPPAAQMHALPDGGLLHDVSGRIGDWADTAGLISGLDLVIAVDTAVAHLAGALGRPVWMLNRFDSCWRWLMKGDDTPWYPTMRLFRQTSQGDWAGVIERVQTALEEQASAYGH